MKSDRKKSTEDPQADTKYHDKGTGPREADGTPIGGFRRKPVPAAPAPSSSSAPDSTAPQA